MHTLLVDDHNLILSGLNELVSSLYPDCTVHLASSSTEAIAIAQSCSLSLAIVDIFLAGEQAFSLIRKLSDSQPDLPIVVLSATENNHHIQKSMDSGASIFVFKSASQEELIARIEDALNGIVYRPSREIDAEQRSPKRDINKLLTDKQKKILQLIGEGKSNKEIAVAFEPALSCNTVKVHVSAILRALDLKNRTQAALLAQEFSLYDCSNLYGD